MSDTRARLLSSPKNSTSLMKMERKLGVSKLTKKMESCLLAAEAVKYGLMFGP